MRFLLALSLAVVGLGACAVPAPGDDEQWQTLTAEIAALKARPSVTPAPTPTPQPDYGPHPNTPTPVSLRPISTLQSLVLTTIPPTTTSVTWPTISISYLDIARTAAVLVTPPVGATGVPGPQGPRGVTGPQGSPGRDAATAIPQAWPSPSTPSVLTSDSPVGVAGKDDRVATDKLACVDGAVPVSIAVTLLASGPDTDVWLYTVESATGFTGVARDISLPEGTEFQVRLRLTCAA